MLLKSYRHLEISNEIEMPDIIDLINSPFYLGVSLDDAYKNGNDVVKYLINKIPLKNNTKYQSLQFQVQYLNYNTIPIDYVDWHQDVSNDNMFTTHLLFNECTGLTEFLLNDIDLNDEIDVERYLKENEIQTIKCQPNKVHTFTDEWHRAGKAKKHEFRFTLRVIENNQYPSVLYNDGVVNKSLVYVLNKSKPLVSIEKNEKSIVLFNNRNI